MKIVPILFPHPCRGETAPYLCTFLRSINTALPRSAYYIVDPACLDWNRFRQRWEFEPWNQWFHEYRIDESLKPDRIEFLDESLFEPLVRKHVTPIRAWRFLILNRYQPLEDFLEAALDRAAAELDGIDCVLTWLNVASLQHVCARRGIALVHNEHGPLRKPTWRHTAYFDFFGVNGQTAAAGDFATFCKQLAHRDHWPSLEHIRDALLTAERSEAPVTAPYRCGVATQLEEDSNLIAFGNGFSSLDVVRHCQRTFGWENVLVRLHPMGMAVVRGHLDTSPNALAFIGCCDEIHTVNSSVAAEALLLGKTVVAYGDTPLRVAMRPQPDGDGTVWTTAGAAFPERAATFFFLSYLMPYGLVFDPAYIGWRLRGPSHLGRMVGHLRHYCGLPPRYEEAPTSEYLAAEFEELLNRLAEAGGAQVTASAAPEVEPLSFEGIPSFYRQIDERQALLRECDALRHERDALRHERDATLASKSWKLTAPLRWLDARLRPRWPS